MGYEINGGRVLTWSLESHLVDHCNLRCANCCTLSPHLRPRFVDPQELERELALAARALRPNVFKLTGGEPLLHPELLACLRIARASGVAAAVSLTTNGLLLASAPDQLFELLDRITLSLYSSAPLPEAVVDRVRERCARHGVVLTLKTIGRFQRVDAQPWAGPGADDAAAVRERHASCWMRVRCHMVHAGRFYTCTRPPHLEQVLAGAGLDPPPLSAHDGVTLEGPDLLRRILAYLESEQPLLSCRYCLGGSGPWEEHRQLSSLYP